MQNLSVLLSPPSSPKKDNGKHFKRNVKKTNLNEVQKEILQCNFGMEVERKIDTSYMKKQLDITEKMRRVVIDWMVQVQIRLKQHSGILYLAVLIMDRFLSLRQCPKSKLQIIAVGCMQIASKFKETYHAGTSEYVYMCADYFKAKEINQVEIIVLESLKFKIRHPTSFYFLHIYWQQLTDASKELLRLAQYFVELSLLELSSQEYLYSEVAFCALYLANKWTGHQVDLKPVRDITGYSGRKNPTCIRHLRHCVQTYGTETNAYPAICKKYQSKIPEFDFPKDE